MNMKMTAFACRRQVKAVFFALTGNGMLNTEFLEDEAPP